MGTQASVRVNGEPRNVEAGTKLAMLIPRAAGAAHEGIAVAVNGAVVPRAQWQEREVGDGDDIEIVRAVQGG
ncbi:MAG TPA: sulfur carrier protein ThiS [Candidatus Krumholzibacteria bacterium]|nr:sulfur carrier protein ThiS [Candidatus Krumholzibacteria bacterium]